MPDSFDHCAREVRSKDKDRFLASLFAPAAQRPLLHALYAFDLEITQAVHRAREPLAGEIRLQWWRDILGGARGEEAAGHPVAAALAETLGRAPTVREFLAELLDARTSDLYAEPIPTLAALEHYALHTEGAIMSAAAALLAVGAVSDLRALANHASAGVVIAEVLRRLASDIARRRICLPSDVLSRHGVSQDDLLSGRASPQLQSALAELRAEARRHLDRAHLLLRSAPRSVRPAFLHMAVAPLTLHRMERPDYAPLANAPEISQWRRQWRIWRLARSL